jgi:hypothetical protein
VKNPDTGKRVARINPAEAWITTDVRSFGLLTTPFGFYLRPGVALH